MHRCVRLCVPIVLSMVLAPVPSWAQGGSAGLLPPVTPAGQAPANPPQTWPRPAATAPPVGTAAPAAQPVPPARGYGQVPGYGQRGAYGGAANRAPLMPRAAMRKPAAAIAKKASVEDSELMPQGMIRGETPTTGDRTLLGHTFHYPRFVDNAFTAASFYVGSSIEFYSQTDVQSTFDAGGEQQTLLYDRELGFVRLRFGTDFRLAEVFSLGVTADYLAEVGANEQTLFLYGGQTGFDIRPQLKLRVARGVDSGAQFAIKPFGIISGGIRAVPQGLLRVLATEIQAIATDLGRTQCLVEADFACAFQNATDIGEAIQLTQRLYGGGASLNYAQALSRYLGGQFSLSLAGASGTTSASYLGELSSSHVLVKAGFSPSINFHPLAPLGMTLEYRFELDKASYDPNEQAGIAEGADATAIGHRGAAGLYYTGRRDLMLGWIAGIASMQDTAHSLQKTDVEPPAFVFAAQFDMRYFF